MYRWSLESRNSSVVPGAMSAEIIGKSIAFWIKFVQKSVMLKLQQSVATIDGSKVHGPFKRLSPFLDDQGIWRVGLRVRHYTPFTKDNVPPAFLPNDSRLTYLLMEQAHQRRHAGVEESVAQFRLMGYWTPQAGKLAKRIRSACVMCRYLDKRVMNQVMGGIPKDQLVNPVAWGQLELDLFGPFACRSDVQKRSTCKVWGMILVDRNSGAIHCDVVMGYSAEETFKTLRRFAALRGWPTAIYSDPGSQLASSSGSLQSWWTDMGERLSRLAGEARFTWKISPADSAWRQGRAEIHIKSVKKLLTLAVGSSRITPTELQTILFESANLMNERPIGVQKTPKSDGTFQVLTPNCLLMGRTLNAVPDDANLTLHMKHADRYHLVQQITADFWSRWSTEVTPDAIIRKKWHETGRNLRPGDVVVIHDRSTIKGDYKLGVVDSVDSSSDRLVRSCKVSYVIPNVKDPIGTYTGGKRVTVSRSIQRLSLILPVEEQQSKLVVEDNKIRSQEDQELNV